MTSSPDIADLDRLLSGLAELSFAVAQSAAERLQAAEDSRDFARLTDAYCKLSRCVRMTIALSVRLRRGEPLPLLRDPRARDFEDDLDDDFEDDDLDDFDERDEGLEREQLFDRLPAGDLPTQIASIARTVAAAAGALPPEVARDVRSRCGAIAAEAALSPSAWPRDLPPAIAAALEAARRPRPADPPPHDTG